MQAQIDKGVEWCPLCDRFGYHTFCGQCGERYHGRELTWRTCKCRTIATTDWCPICGVQIISDRRKSFEAGTLDLEAASQRAITLREKYWGPVESDSDAPPSPPNASPMQSAVLAAFPRAT